MLKILLRVLSHLRIQRIGVMKMIKTTMRPSIAIPFKTNPPIKIPWSCLMDPTRSNKSAIKCKAETGTPMLVVKQQPNAAISPALPENSQHP